MEKIKRYRNAQKQSFDEFFNFVTDSGICQYCDNYQECVEAMGIDNIECISGNGCSAFDTSVDNIKNIYLLEKCVPINSIGT